MKKIILALMLTLLMITGVFAADNLISTEQVSQNSTTREIGNSYIDIVTLDYQPGATFDLEFQIQQISSDAEWIDGASITFPTGVTVNSAENIGYDGLMYNDETGDGITVTWGDLYSDSGYGDFYGSATFNVNVTIDSDFSGDMLINWFIKGDGYGSSPHTVNGSVNLPQVLEGTPDIPTLVSPANNAINVAIDANLEWTTGDNTDHSILYLADNVEFTGATIVNPATSPYSTSLNDGTTYFWKVVAVGPTDIETTSSVNRFTTAFLPITDFPWTESFEGDEPNWVIIDNNDDGDMWDTNYTSNPYEGSEAAVINTDFNSGNNDDYLISPALTLTGNERLKFWYRVQSANEPNDFRVVLSTTGIEPADFTNIILPLTECSSTTYQEQVINLSAYSGDCYFAFHVPPGGLDGWRLYIDYVTVEEIPEGEPQAPILASPTQGALNVAIDTNLEWTVDEITDHSILYLADNEEFTDATVVNPATSPYSASLNGGTSYFWKVVAVGPTSIETTSSINSFTTEFLPITEFPYTEGFEGDWIGSPSAPLGWEQITVSGLKPWVSYSSSPHSGSKCAQGPWASGGGEHLLITPTFAFDAATTYRLRFWLKGSTNANYTSDLHVQIASDYIDATSFTDELAHYSPATNMPGSWEEQVIDLAGYSGNHAIAFRLYDENGMSLYIDDVSIEEVPEGSLISITPDAHDFGDLFIGYEATKTFTIANSGAVAAEITGVDVPTGYTMETTEDIPLTLEPNSSFVVTVTFTPVNEMVYSGNLRVKEPTPGNPFVTKNTDAALTGTGIPIPQGATCQNPIPLTFPAVDISGHTSDYGDFYSRNWIEPPSYYLNGDDVVYQFTLDNARILSGTITTTNNYIGAFILQDEPNEANPAPVILSKTSSSGNTLTYTNEMLDVGTYYLIISSYPSPQSIDYTINLTADPLPVPAAATSPSPTHEASDQLTALTLGWINATYTETIDLWFGEVGSRSMAKVLDNVTAVNSYEVTDLSPNTTYNWKVVNRNYSGETADTLVATWLFTTVGSAPEAVAYNGPADEAIDRYISGNLTWNAATGAEGYRVYLSTDETFTSVIPVEQPGTSYAYAGLEYSTTYYWKVIPYNIVGEPEEGILVWSFTTIPLPFPDADLVFDGVRATGHYMPLTGNYAYAMTQNIYYQSELNIEDSAITSISYLYNMNTAWSETIEIFMGHTDKDVFDTTTDWITEGFTHVFSGTMSVNTTDPIVTLTLDTPFVYNNSDNLVVLFFATQPGYNNYADHFYNYPVVGNRSITYRNDSTNPYTQWPNPTITASFLKAYIPVTGFNYTEIGEEPQFTVNAEALAFGEQFVHTESAPQTLSVSNLGLGALSINSLILTGANADQFELTDENEYPVILGTGDNMLVSVVYAPISGGEHFAEIQITDDQGRAVRVNSTTGNREMHSVTLTGNCVDPTIYELPFTEGFENNNVHNSTDVYMWSQVSEEGSDPWTINETLTTYNRTPRSGSFNATLKYGNTDWLIRAIELVGGQSYDVELYARQNVTSGATIGIYYGTEATVTSMEEITGQIGVVDGDYQLIDGTFIPATSGIYYIGIKAALTSSPWYISIDDISIRETPTTPVADISTTDLNFGTVFANESVSEEISIRNVGVGTLNVSAIEIDGLNADEFSYSTQDGASMALTQGQSLNITVQFTPVSEGDKEATLQIIDDLGRRFRLNSATRTTNNNRNVNEVALTGNCVDPTIYELPFFEGFEDNNVHDSEDVYMWSQVSETGIDLWTINETLSTYNRTPRSGSFNATLKWSNKDWLIRPIELVGGQSYDVELYARQDGTSGATVGIYYGTEATTASMSEITGEIDVVNGEYQLIDGTFTPATSGIYHIGIKGSATYTPFYISIDDIAIRESEPAQLDIPANVTMTSTESGLMITWDPVEGANSYVIYATDRRGGEYEIIDTVSETSYTPDGVDRVKLFKIKASPESINSITGFSRRGRN